MCILQMKEKITIKLLISSPLIFKITVHLEKAIEINYYAQKNLHTTDFTDPLICKNVGYSTFVK